MKNVESSMDWMSFSNKMKQVTCQLSSSACPMVLVLPDGREVRFTDINVDTFDYKGKRGDTEYTSIGFKVNLLGAEVRNGKDDGSLASSPYGNGAKMREALEPKTDTEWEAICARCREGESPKECQYYGDPDGCSADGHYPMTQIGNAAKMREVVELLARVILPPQEEYPAEYGGGKVPDEDGWLAWIRQVQSYAKSALAEPPRNCDLFNSGDAVKDAQAVWDALGPKVAMELDFLIAFTWLFRKAKRMCGVRYESEVAK